MSNIQIFFGYILVRKLLRKAAVRLSMWDGVKDTLPEQVTAEPGQLLGERQTLNKAPIMT